MTNTPESNKSLPYNDSAVLQHMAMYQNIITRMAANSSACKNWSIMLTSAFLTFIISKEQADMAWVGLLPVLLFGFLDAYYLALEKQFRAASNDSAEKIRQSAFHLEHLFLIKTDGKLPRHMKESLQSYATWPLYVVLLAMLLFAWL